MTAEDSITGNIYHDRYWDQGQNFHSYYVDCALCSREDVLDCHGRRAATVARKLGWYQNKAGKWICPDHPSDG